MAETVKGLNVSLGLDASKFDEGLKKVSNQIREQGKEMKKVNELLRYDKGNIDLWRQKQTLLNNTLTSTKDRLALNNKKLKEMRENGKDISDAEFKALENAISKDEVAIAKLNHQLEQTNKNIDKLGKANIEGIVKFGNNLTNKITKPALAAGTALAALTYATYANLDEMYDKSTKVGLTIEEYQRLGYAAEILAVDSNVLQKALIKTNSLLGDITSGESQKAEKALSMIGLDLKDLEGLSTYETFLKIASALSKIEDQATKIAVLNDIYGERTGAELVQLVGADEEVMKDLLQEAGDLGLATEAQAEAAGTLTDEMLKLQKVGASFVYDLGNTLVPLMIDGLSFLKDEVLPSLKNVVNTFSGLPEPIKKITAGIVLTGIALGPVLSLGGRAALLVNQMIQISPKILTKLKAINKQTLLTAAGFASLAGSAHLVIDIVGNFESLTSAQVLLKGLAASALAAAGAIAVFHASWSVGAAVAGIGAGITAALAAIKIAQEQLGIEDTTGPSQTLANSTKAASSQVNTNTATSSSSVDNSTNTYNITIEANEYTTAEEVANMLALKVQSRR